MECILCERVRLIKQGKYPYLIHEFRNSYLLLGEHQYYKGYCVLITKGHQREMTDIPSPMREEIFQDMMVSSKIIQDHFLPKKMNLCSLGNVCEHLHWHFFPRYADDANFKNPPWLQMKDFDGAKVTPEECHHVVSTLKKKMSEHCYTLHC
jgi:diadenosine tetraphosphate (Ap4A) HIT family hydrolase